MLMAKNVENLTSVDFLPALRIGAQADSRIAKPILSTTGRTGIADDREKKFRRRGREHRDDPRLSLRPQAVADSN